VYTQKQADGKFGEKAIVDRHESEIKLNSQNISLKVDANGVIGAINLSSEAATIQAKKIYLDGYVEAKHIRSGSLKGVVIMTEDPTSANNHMRLEKQDLTLHGTGQARGYFGFVPAPTGQFREALVLGADYTNATNTQNGALVIEHTTPNAINFSSSVARIGVYDGVNKTDMSSFLAFERYDNWMKLWSKGQMSIHGYGMIDINADGTSLLKLRGGNQMQLISGSGHWQFAPTDGDVTKITSDLYDDGDKVQFSMGYKAIKTYRSAGYSQYGFYFMSGLDSTSYASINAHDVWVANNSTVTNKLTYKTYEQTSTRDIKTAIKDIKLDPLETLMQMKPRQYIFKSDLNKLYEMREKAKEEGSDKVITTDDIFQQYGFIVDELPSVFHGEGGNTVSPYTISTINIAATQQIKRKQDVHGTEIEALKATSLAQEKKIQEQEDRLTQLEAFVQQLLAN